jgi:hypothetical protein
VLARLNVLIRAVRLFDLLKQFARAAHSARCNAFADQGFDDWGK